MLNHELNPELPKPRPVVGWAGGKHKLLKHLLPRVPAHTCYVEVFGGGLALFNAKPPSPVEVVNDVHGDLVSFYRCVKFHRDALLDELDMVLNSRREFEDYGRQPGLTEIQRAARWFLRNKLSFGGQGTSFAITRTTPHSSRAQRLLAIMSLNRRMDHTTIEERTWDKLMPAYDSAETFFFVDPPYLDSGGNNYGGWSEHELERFCSHLKKVKGQWLFTFQDCPQVRALMAGFPFKAIVRPKGIHNKVRHRAASKYREVVVSSLPRASARMAA